MYVCIFISYAGAADSERIRTNRIGDQIGLIVLHDVIATLFYVVHQYIVLGNQPFVQVVSTYTGNHCVKLRKAGSGNIVLTSNFTVYPICSNS